MAGGYVQILIESLEKKIEVLDKVMVLNKEQARLSSIQPMDMKAYDETMEQKGVLIDEINRLDEGFSTTFEHVKEEMTNHKEEYALQIARLQDLIRETVDKSVAVEAQEKRNRAALEAVFRAKRQEIKQLKCSTATATKYYKAMSRINNVDPQLMDRRK